MSDPNNIEVKFTARTDGVEQGAAGAAQAIQNAVAQMRSQFEGLASAVKGVQSQIEGMLSGVQAAFAKFNNVMFAVQNAMAGGEMFKEFVASAMETTKNAYALGSALGITATEASTLRAAAGNVGVSFDTLQQAGLRLSRTILTNEDAVKELGVATRDAQGHFRNTRDVMLDVNDRLREFKEGTDRNVEGMKIYGRQWQEIAPMVKLFRGETEETRKEAAALNLVVGQESVDAMIAYKTAQNEVGDVMEGIRNTIGQALMPGLTDMAQWFRSVGPQAVEITRGAMATWLIVMDNVKSAVKTMWNAVVDMASGVVRAINEAFGRDSEPMTAMQFVENVLKVIQVAFISLRIGVEESVNTISGILKQLANDARMVGGVIGAALHGDWEGVKAAWAQFKADTKATMQATMDEALKIAQKGRADIDAAIAGTPMAAAKVTPIAGGGGTNSDGNTASQDKDRVATWEAINKAAKDNYELTHNLRQRDLADDVAYWEMRLAQANRANGEYEKVQLKVADARLALMKQQATQARALDEENISEAEKSGLDALALTKAQYDQKYQLGLISKAQMIAIEEDLENQKLAIQKAAQEARIALVEQDPNHSPAALQKEKDKLLEIERKYQEQITQLRTKAAVEDQAYAVQFGKSLEQSFSSLIQKFATGTMTIKSLLIGMGQAVLGSLTKIFADIAAKWLATQIMQRIAGTVTALGQIASHAAVAGAAAFASTAAIPIVGPMLAPAAAAASYAGAMSFAPLATIPSAAGGFDIPAGVNPLTQLHAREMVLPAKYADMIRDTAEGGAGGSVQPIVQIVGEQLKGGFFMVHQDDLVKALKDASRKFKFGG